MNIYIVEDDIGVIKILEKIVSDRNLGHVIGYSRDGEEGEKKIAELRPDIVLVDLLMPGKDGISLVKAIKERGLETYFVMISQVSNKDMVGKAYQNGVEYFIQKPVNALEVESIVSRVVEKIEKDRTLGKIQNLFMSNEKVSHRKETKDDFESRIKRIMQKIGILGELGVQDIIEVVKFLRQNNSTMSDYTLKEVCSSLSDNAKSMEQRIRRTSSVGIVNLANLGIEDYMNETFVEFSNSLYNFEQVKKEMDYIRGNSKKHGKVNLKKFIDGLLFYSENK